MTTPLAMSELLLERYLAGDLPAAQAAAVEAACRASPAWQTRLAELQRERAAFYNDNSPERFAQRVAARLDHEAPARRSAPRWAFWMGPSMAALTAVVVGAVLVRQAGDELPSVVTAPPSTASAPAAKPAEPEPEALAARAPAQTLAAGEAISSAPAGGLADRVASERGGASKGMGAREKTQAGKAPTGKAKAGPWGLVDDDAREDAKSRPRAAARAGGGAEPKNLVPADRARREVPAPPAPVARTTQTTPTKAPGAAAADDAEEARVPPPPAPKAEAAPAPSRELAYEESFSAPEAGAMAMESAGDATGGRAYSAPAAPPPPMAVKQDKAEVADAESEPTQSKKRAKRAASQPANTESLPPQVLLQQQLDARWAPVSQVWRLGKPGRLTVSTHEPVTLAVVAVVPNQPPRVLSAPRRMEGQVSLPLNVPDMGAGTVAVFVLWSSRPFAVPHLAPQASVPARWPGDLQQQRWMLRMQTPVPEPPPPATAAPR